jgi:hypothetical protein
VITQTYGTGRGDRELRELTAPFSVAIGKGEMRKWLLHITTGRTQNYQRKSLFRSQCRWKTKNCRYCETKK